MDKTLHARTRLAAASILLAATWLAMLLFGEGRLDARVYEALYAGRNPSLVPIARGLSAIGQPVVLVSLGVLVALWLWLRERFRLGVSILAVTLIGRAVAEVQKFEVARVRPALEPHLVVVQTSSFPSGHAASSMIVGLTLALALTSGSRWQRSAVAFAVLLSLLIGISRVMLGVHWPSDVIGGWSFGALWVLLTLPFSERLFRSEQVPVRR